MEEDEGWSEGMEGMRKTAQQASVQQCRTRRSYARLAQGGRSGHSQRSRTIVDTPEDLCRTSFSVALLWRVRRY